MAFEEETAVTMADGQFVAIGELVEGDEVMALDIEKKKMVPAKVTALVPAKLEKVVSVRIAEELTCSEEQLFVMKDFSSKKAVDLRPGDIVLTEQMLEAAVKSVRAVERQAELTAIKTDKGTFVAEGIIVSE
ncbi:MAG: Hint domain-containing protein [Candidatus Nanoarchaeia archaeon]|nr:Hint domain-containing protein [Candidatus Nanoarchaeia archaeon]